MVIVRTKNGQPLGAAWTPIKSLYWPSKKLLILPRMSLAKPNGKLHDLVLRLPVSLYARKVGNEIHVEVIGYRRRLIFIDPQPEDFLSLRNQIREFTFDLGTILFSKFYLFFGDLTEDLGKVKIIKNAIAKFDIRLAKKMIEEISVFGDGNDKSTFRVQDNQKTP